MMVKKKNKQNKTKPEIELLAFLHFFFLLNLPWQKFFLLEKNGVRSFKVIPG